MTEEEKNHKVELEKLENKLQELQKKLKNCQQEKEDYLSGWKRNQASFLNYKKKEQERLDRIKEDSKKNLILEILPVLDSFDRAESSSDNSEGLRQIKKEMKSILKKEGLKKMEVGDKFDPNFHEAVEHIPCEEEEGKILEEVKTGYRYEDQVIRAAKVKVAAEKNKD